MLKVKSALRRIINYIDLIENKLFKNNNSEIRDRLIILEVIVFIGLTLSYILVVAKKYNYMGFDYLFQIDKFLFGMFLTILFMILGYIIKNDFFFAVYHIILMYYFFGTTIYFQYNTVTIDIVISQCILLIILFFFSCININIKIPSYNIEKNPIMAKILLGIAIIGLLPFIYHYIKYINLKNLLLIDVYESRYLFRKINVRYLGYLVSPLARIIAPILVIYSLEYKKKLMLAISISIIVYIYLCGAVKSIFIGLFAVILFYRYRYKNKPIFFALLIMFLTYIGIVLYLLFNNVTLIDAFVRRVFFIPPKLDEIYYTVFKNGHLYWAHSPFGKLFIDYKLDRHLSIFIGEVILGTKGLNANVGVITEGYVSAGFIGVLLHSIIIGSIFVYIKSLNIHPKYFGSIFLYIFYLNTSFLSILLLTHGLGFLILFLTLFLANPKKTSNKLIYIDK